MPKKTVQQSFMIAKDNGNNLLKLDEIKEEEAWTDWRFASTIWNFNVGKNAREGVHGLEDSEHVKYHMGMNRDKLYVKTAFAGKLVPHLVRKLIQKYSSKDEVVLDAFCGSGTIPVEAKLNGRKCIAVDVNPLCVELTRKKLRALRVDDFEKGDYLVRLGDACDLDFVTSESVDMILTHPPYWGLIDYSAIEKDLSNLGLDEYLSSMKLFLSNAHRVLKPERFCVVVIGDVRKTGVVPLGAYLSLLGLDVGFNLWDLLIYDTRFGGKQVNRFRKIRSQQKKFHLTDHDYVLVFRKRKQGWRYVDISDLPFEVKEHPCTGKQTS